MTYAKNARPLDRNRLPDVVFDTEPGFVDLYWKTWELGWDHVVERAGAPQSPYMDEAFDPNTIWIWDTCLMVHFCKYAPDLFPGIESFQNFYEVMHDGRESSLAIQHPDNPPLFAWIEYEYYRFTGDQSRLRNILVENQYLQKHFQFFESCEPGTCPPYAKCKIAAKRVPHGYMWSGCPNGMDNTPRGRDKYESILWVDALAQQALAADHIIRIAELLNEPVIAAEYRKVYAELRDLADRYYWSEADGTFYDVTVAEPHEQVRVKTPASYWPMLAGLCNPEQAAALAAAAGDPAVFGGDIPWPSVDAADPDFSPEGMYWRGGVWLPTAYMATKALERYGYGEIADQNAERLLHHMLDTYRDYEPATIWECYSPTQPKPATLKQNQGRSRPDFCGWSALGPISLLIENVIGIYSVDAVERRVRWRLHQQGRHGVRRLTFGTVCVDMVAENGEVSVDSNEPFTLELNGQSFDIQPGAQTIPVP